MHNSNERSTPSSPRSSAPPFDKNRAKWGFAQGPKGELVIRNWYFIIGFGILAVISLGAVFSAPLATLVTAPVIGWVLLLEGRGVQIHEGKVTYPVRLGLDGMGGIVPLFPRELDLSEVSNATTTTVRAEVTASIHFTYRVAYLTGEFGTAKLGFDTKGGRDRLFAILRDSYPSITIYRWT
ncbi:MAG: hypothetical protein KF854_00885 [Nitrospira sp.]|nr:hypothetical protein [Nitrospira sp.]MBX3513110.1 hypothetical protein [Xanthobacteraceae bacterium]